MSRIVVCPDCRWAHPSDAVRPSGSYFFGSDGYVAVNVPGAAARPTRAAAMRDYCEWRQARARERAAFAALLDAEGNEQS